MLNKLIATFSDELVSFCNFSAGITFVSVHDCYWTHASDVPVMNKVDMTRSSLGMAFGLLCIFLV